jgi:hypothetical protein
MKEPLCWVPYYSMEVAPFNRPHPCCKIKHYKGASDQVYDVVGDFNSDHAVAWRRDHFENREELHDDCAVCKEAGPPGQERFSTYGMKESADFKRRGFPTPTDGRGQLKKLQLGIDNICASTCMMCVPMFSNSIGQLLKDNPIYELELRSDHRHFYPDGIPQVTAYDLDQLEGQLDDLQQLHLWGGEPLFSPNLPRVIELLKNSSKLRFISISTGMRKINRRSLELLAAIPSEVNITFSISMEGPLDLNHWIRGISPQEFEDSFSLLEEFNKRFTFNGHHTLIGGFNVFAIPEYIDTVIQLETRWRDNGGLRETTEFNSIYASSVQIPAALHPRNLPQDIKDRVRAKLIEYGKTAPSIARNTLQVALKSMELPSNLRWSECLTFMNAFPKYRGQVETFDYWIKRYL